MLELRKGVDILAEGGGVKTLAAAGWVLFFWFWLVFAIPHNEADYLPMVGGSVNKTL